MKENDKEKSCECCSDPYSVLISKKSSRKDNSYKTGGIHRSDFLKVIGLGFLGLSSVAGTKSFAHAEKSKNLKIIKGKEDRMIIDKENKELRISATVTRIVQSLLLLIGEGVSKHFLVRREVKWNHILSLQLMSPDLKLIWLFRKSA